MDQGDRPSWYGSVSGRFVGRKTFTTEIARAKRDQAAVANVDKRPATPVDTWVFGDRLIVEYSMGLRIRVLLGFAAALLVSVTLAISPAVPSLFQMILVVLDAIPYLGPAIVTMLQSIPWWVLMLVGLAISAYMFYAWLQLGFAGIFGKESIEIDPEYVVLRQRIGRWRVYEYRFERAGVKRLRITTKRDKEYVDRLPLHAVATSPYWEHDGTIAFSFRGFVVLAAADVPAATGELVLGYIAAFAPELVFRKVLVESDQPV